MEIYLVRHTVPEVAKGICYGQSDIPLAETFHADIQKTLPLLPDKVDAAYSSPLIRCLKLAECIKSNQKVIYDKRLMEMNFGSWEMKKWDEIDSKKLNIWMKDFVNVRATGGENFTDLNIRSNEFVDELLKKDYGSVVVVTHAGVIRSILCQVLEIPLLNAFKTIIDYGSVTKIQVDNNTFYKSVLLAQAGRMVV
jgi:alpha-ribazole phosphatase